MNDQTPVVEMSDDAKQFLEKLNSGPEFLTELQRLLAAQVADDARSYAIQELFEMFLDGVMGYKEMDAKSIFDEFDAVRERLQEDDEDGEIITFEMAGDEIRAIVG